MLFPIITFITAISIAAIAAWFSVYGLMAIFTASAVAVAIMAVALEVGKLVSESKEFSAVLKEALKCGKPMLITMHKRSRNPLLQSIRKRDDLRTLEVTPINSAILPSKAVNILKTGMV